VRIATVLLIGLLCCGTAEPVVAQDGPSAVGEVIIGRSGFVDEAWDDFTTIGGAARIFVTPKIAVGPEIAYLVSNAPETNGVSMTGVVTWDFVPDDGRPRIVPYLVAGVGYLRQKTLVGRGPGRPGLQPFTSGEGTVSGGLGLRVGLGPYMFVASEFRLGWEPERRIAVTVGTRIR
jgi:hypothetical protein